MRTRRWCDVAIVFLSLGVGGDFGPAVARGSGAPDRPLEGRLKVAILPFAPRGAPPQAWQRLREALPGALAACGIDPVDAGAVEAALRSRRLRDVSLLERREMADLAAALGAERLLLGSIYRLDEGAAPAVSLSGRLIDPSGLGLEAMAFTVVEGQTLLGPLGAGGPVTLARILEVAARRLAESLCARRRGAPGHGHDDLLRTSVLAPSPLEFVSPRLQGRAVGRVVVLPFRNHSERPGAGQAAADLVSWCLVASSGLSVLDAGDATRHLLQGGWRTGMAVGRAHLASLGIDPAIDAVVMGSVHLWVEGDPAGLRPPEIAVSFRLLDTATGDILWAADHDRRGDQTRTLFEAGNVRLAEALMARAAFEALAPLLDALRARTPSAPGGSRP
jgi:hypothetical protein